MNETASTVTRAEALRFNDRWTDYDREVVGREIDRLADRTSELVRIKSGQYIRASGDHRTALMYIGAGYVCWYNEVFDELPDKPDGTERSKTWTTIWLSTHVEQGKRSRGPEEDLTYCPICFIVLPKTGICDDHG